MYNDYFINTESGFESKRNAEGVTYLYIYKAKEIEFYIQAIDIPSKLDDYIIFCNDRTKTTGQFIFIPGELLDRIRGKKLKVKEYIAFHKYIDCF